MKYGYYILYIYNPEDQWLEKRYSLELEKNDYSVYIGENKINFALDDLEVLETEFKDVIRDNKLRNIGI